MDTTVLEKLVDTLRHGGYDKDTVLTVDVLIELIDQTIKNIKDQHVDTEAEEWLNS